MSENNKIILLEWDGYHRQYRSLRYFEYNGIKYPPGELVKPFIVDLMKSDKKKNDKNHSFVIIDEIRLSCKEIVEITMALNEPHEIVLKDVIFKNKSDIARFVKEMMKYIE